MKRNKIYYLSRSIHKYIVLIFFIIVTCDYENGNEEIDLYRNDIVSIYDVFSEVFIIPLEATDESLISQIYQIEYYNEKYYILDRRLQTIFCFDAEGKFKFKISRQGKGPGEYLFIQHFSICQENYILYLLEPMGKIHSYSLSGSFIETMNINEIHGYSEIYPLGEEILLLISGTGYEVQWYSIKEQRIIHKEFKLPEFALGRFRTSVNGAYQYGTRTYLLPALQRIIYDVTGFEPKKHFQWSFGKLNNSPQQIKRLIETLENMRPGEELWLNDAVAGQNLINYHIFSVYENSRFKIAILEFDNDFKHVFVDKHNSERYVFNNFKEDIALHNVNFSGDYIITHNQYIGLSRADRNLSQYQRDTFSKIDQLKLDAHNPETENPLLVVYKLKN